MGDADVESRPQRRHPPYGEAKGERNTPNLFLNFPHRGSGGKRRFETKGVESTEEDEDEAQDHESDDEYDELLESALPQSTWYSQGEADEAEYVYIVDSGTFQEARDLSKKK